ncbi:MAG: YlbF family regulator [Peptococcaceae bacterium]|nr:YlbF family regulator [Peptococcaceae bacterium]
MSILQKARELGEELASSVELEEMKEAELKMMKDPGASRLVREFNEKQRKFMDLKASGVELTSEQVAEVEDLERRVMENPLIVDFFRKQQDFERIIQEINEIIARAITGESGACSDECCSNCSGCS